MDDFAALKDLPLEADDEFGSGLKFTADDELPALHDGNFGAPEGETLTDHDFGSGLKFSADDELPKLHDGSFGLDTLTTQGHAPLDEPASDAAARQMPSFQLDHLALAPLDESFMPSAALAESPEKSPSPLLGSASAWALVDEGDAVAAPASAPAAAASFGIEKLSAADFLAPEGGEEASSIIEPGMKLELVSMEEALAPKEYDAAATEMILGDLDSAISRLLVLGAAADSLEAVCSFLSMLPADLRAAVLHVQHLGGKSVEALSDTLTRYSELPVRIAANGVRARIGEVLVVPDGQQARVHRDGRVELQSLDNSDVRSSPIDASFTLAANVFGRNAQAIVFAGQANDALGGCQAIHDRGGQVWIESSDGQFADMVHGIEAERLHSYSGTPAELAARLVEEMSMEGRR
jgi:chemotaxis response regulator CheB